MMRSGCRLSRRRSLTEVSTQAGKVKRNSSTMLSDIWLPEAVVMLIGGEEGGGRGRRGGSIPYVQRRHGIVHVPLRSEV